MIDRDAIAFTASYYGLSPLDVEKWTTAQVYEWHTAACSLEKEKAKAYEKMTDGQKS